MNRKVIILLPSIQVHGIKQPTKNLIKDPEKDFLLPIVFACDETKLSKTGKSGCWPFLFTTTIFNQKLCNKGSAWRPLLGNVYDINTVDSKQERAHQSNEYKGERLHGVLHTSGVLYWGTERRPS